MNDYLAIFDVETTGLSPKDDRILQIAAVKLNKQTMDVEQSWSAYVCPSGDWKITPAAEVTHGLTTEFIIKNGRPFKDVAKEFVEFIDGCDIGGYNSNSFDVKFIYNEFTREGLEFPFENRKYIDIFLMESQINPRDLRSVFERYTGKTMEDSGLDAHNACSDVDATAEVLRRQMKNHSLSWEEIESWPVNDLSSPDGSVRKADDDLWVFTFGKYRDQDIFEVCKVDPGYLSWWASTIASKYTIDKVRSYLKKRKSNK